MHLYPPLSINGLKHVGKSSVARLTARALKADYFDTDEMMLHISSAPGQTTIRDLYRSVGKEEFQRLEAEALSRITTGIVDGGPGALISTGGGICDNAAAFEILLRDTVPIVLDEEPAVLYDRISARGIPAYLDPDRPYAHFIEIADRRRRRYLETAAHVISVRGMTLAEIVDALVSYLNNRSDYGRQ